METGIEVKTKESELPTLREAFTNYEEFLFGSSIPHPSHRKGKIYNFLDIVNGNFPDWVFMPRNREYSIQQLNAARRGQFIDMGLGFGPFDPNTIPDPDHIRFRIYFNQLTESKDPQRVEFGFTKTSDDRPVPEEFPADRIIKVAKYYPEFEGRFRLEDASHPGRKYLVPVLKS